MGVCTEHSTVSLLLLWPDPSTTLQPTVMIQPAAAVAKIKHNTAMHSQPAAAAAAETKHNPTLQLPYKKGRGSANGV
jgi:hypothetical protein